VVRRKTGSRMQEEGKQEVVGRRKTGIGKKVNRKQEKTQ
jgi:hypothetical protein